MAGITLAQATAQLAVWLDADTKVASNQSVDINGRTLTLANAAIIRDNIEYWDAKVQKLSRGGIIMKGITPC